ncbi:hypothetical protein VTG60DRAFT_6974 [Thermothelomyces hinnuleus]
MLPHRCQTLGSGDSLVIRTNQRLPPISDLLRDVPLPPSLPSSQPPSQKQSYPTILPPTSPTPIPCSPTFFPGAFPTWSTSPPCSRSASQQYTQFPPLSRPVDLRRATIPCADRDRQRRTTKQQARLRSGLTLSDPGPQPRQHHPPPNNSLLRRPKAAATRQPGPAAPARRPGDPRSRNATTSPSPSSRKPSSSTTASSSGCPGPRSATPSWRAGPPSSAASAASSAPTTAPTSSCPS